RLARPAAAGPPRSRTAPPWRAGLWHPDRAGFSRPAPRRVRRRQTRAVVHHWPVPVRLRDGGATWGPQVRPPEVGRPAQPVRVGLAPQLTRHRVVLRGDGRLTTSGATATPRAPDHPGRALAAFSAPTRPAHHHATRSTATGRRPSRRTPASRPPA